MASHLTSVDLKIKTLKNIFHPFWRQMSTLDGKTSVNCLKIISYHLNNLSLIDFTNLDLKDGIVGA